MADKEVLSQEEIDTLVKGVENNAVDTSAGENSGVIRDFDFAAQERIVSGRMAGLNGINERFIRTARGSFMNLLRRNVDISVLDLSTLKSGEYFSSLSAPTCINLVRMRPLLGTACIILSYKMVYLIVNFLFGGDQPRENAKISPKEFTSMETRIIGLVLNMIFKDLQEAWKPIYKVDFEYVSLESNPQLINVISPTEIIIIEKYRFSIDGQECDLDICIPYALVEPIRSSLETGTSDSTEINEQWAQALREEIFDSPVEVTGNLVEKTINVKQLLQLKPDDVLPVEMSDFITLFAGGIPTFRSKFGVSQGKCAVKILERVKRV
jgi:flagellar motor switch protein FliM